MGLHTSELVAKQFECMNYFMDDIIGVCSLMQRQVASDLSIIFVASYVDLIAMQLACPP